MGILLEDYLPDDKPDDIGKPDIHGHRYIHRFRERRNEDRACSVEKLKIRSFISDGLDLLPYSCSSTCNYSGYRI